MSENEVAVTPRRPIRAAALCTIRVRLSASARGLPLTVTIPRVYSSTRPYDDRHSRKETAMPMIDVTAVAGTFADKRALTRDLTAAMMKWEKVPPLALFRENTAAFVHDLAPDAIGNA